ncbi:PREDICTED: ejaculatory bulb-specific protein 3-like [Vollenhovia emeryi]|uniref:ejaculatory bulb-specific protein 3-like n=1 Tax=Vollenhovia emeryi TaxID=411798 RepID=UPI0005F37700|nr:PREDICTED: ejaculatory bulb-specific protein 3-like [Vollenhovia emeryi]XP_011860866.1 PREDICTED: ejaculatory bulb-specific protein 3-like [Vollenhovia emeryi]
MRFTFVLSLLLFSGLVLGTEYYLDTYDNIDVDAIISSDRLLNQYVNCILDKGPCTADGRSLKLIIPEAIATKCEQCSDKQKQMARKVCKHLKEHRPNIWTEFLERYDPDKEYIAAYEQFLVQEAKTEN